jgi:hypothetical protein
MADIMMTVSDSFFAETSNFLHTSCRCKRFYLSEVDLQVEVPKENVLTIAYSGNLGQLYDFQTLIDVLSDPAMGTIQFFIVGDGDRREWLLRELSRKSLSYEYFGSVYDSVKLSKILSRAHVGFNGFINTSAAFSTKASTYFAAGLPILNSMGGDLGSLVTERELGLNYTGGDQGSLRSMIARLNQSSIRRMSHNCRSFFKAELERQKVDQDVRTFLRTCFSGIGGVSHAPPLDTRREHPADWN